MLISVDRHPFGLVVNPAPSYLEKYLQYSHRSFKTKNWKRVNHFEKRLLYHKNEDGSITTLHGFYHKILREIENNLDSVQVRDYRIKLPEIDWQAVKNIGLRDYQKPIFVDYLLKLQNDSGIVNATGGFGKSYCATTTYAAFSSLNTIVAAPLKKVSESLYNLFKEKFPDKDIGMVGNGFHNISEDVTITTYKSLANCALEKCQLLIMDEIQSSVGDEIQNIITTANPIRVVGMTATDKGTFSNSDKVIKGLFGERLIYIDYEEAVEKQAVVPCQVIMIRIHAGLGTYGNNIESIIRKGIEQNSKRNELIGKVLAKIPDKWQSITHVNHVKHLINICKYIPADTKYVHRESSKEKAGLYALTAKQQKEVIEEFEHIELRNLICTGCLKAGFSAQNARVIIQASGGSSEIDIPQEAFRGSRTLGKELQEEHGLPDKDKFYVIDFMDEHDEFLKGQSNKRIEIYKKQGWDIKIVNEVEEIEFI